MSNKTIKIYYNIADIPNIADRSGFSREVLGFRNAAMEHIEGVLMAAGLGEWAGAEIGAGEVSFGFEVEDFDIAEAEIRQAVAGTAFANFREIVRHEFSLEGYIQTQQAALKDPVVRNPLSFLELLGLLVFRRMPKRFREE